MTLATFSASGIEFAIGNLAMALPLGLVAWWLQRGGRQPFLAHLLWLVVLIKLVTPPVYSLRISPPSAPVPNELAMPDVAPSAASLDAPLSIAGWLLSIDWQIALVGVWIAGSAIVLIWTTIRAFRFNRLLRSTSKTAAAGVQALTARRALALGFEKTPEIRVTAARVSPMVWWIGGPVRIYIPQSLVGQMSHAELGDILAHELGHIRRGDHYVRWLECLVSIALWWNPLAWWARRNLRVCEEICCDALVISKTRASRDAYAGALVSAMELLAVPAIRPSGLASHVNGGFIERRIRMILFGDKISQMPRWLRGLVLTCSALLLTLGFSLAQEPGDLDRVQEWLDSGVNSAFLTAEQAEIMMNSLRASERGSDFDLVDADGNFIIMKRQVTGDGEEVIIDVEFDGDPSSPDPLAFAERSIQERVAAGEISQAEADTFLAELNNAFARDGSVNVRTVKMLGVDGESIEVVSEDSNVIRVVRKGPPN